jgi:hypothetical protein
MDEGKYDHCQKIEGHKTPDFPVTSNRDAHGDFRAAGGLKVNMEPRDCELFFT